jgi:glycosyltransferase involved in cell wall biosynthesis
MLEGVVQLGYVGDEELVALYRGCSAFVYPSYYEGFGFPVLEALASGAPVVTSNISSLPEVAGDAAVLIDPRSIEAIADGLERVLFDAGEAARLRVEGPIRAGLFAYDRCATQVVEVYRQAAGT